MNFQYRGHEVRIVTNPGKKGVTEYWFVLDSRPVLWSKSQDKIERISRNFIDVMCDEEYLIKRQLWFAK